MTEILPLIWEYSARAIQWIPTWQGLDGFQKSLRSCASEESSLSIGRVNPSNTEETFVKDISRHKCVSSSRNCLTLQVCLTLNLPNFTILPNFTLPNFTSGLSLLQLRELWEQVRADQWRTGNEGLMVCDNSPRSAYHAPTSSNYPKLPTGHSFCTCWHTGSLHNTLEINTPTLPLSHGTYRVWLWG